MDLKSGRSQFAILAAALIAFGNARAQDNWPSKPIRLVSPFAPGGAIDVLNRLIADRLGARLGQPVIVDARPGAHTIIGIQEVAKAAPDGYTFMITTMSSMVNNRVVYANLPYDPVKDFAPITQLSMGSVMLVAPANAPYKDLKGFIEWAKAQNRPISYGSWGVGSSGHLYGVILQRNYGLAVNHVPYKGEVPSIIDVRNGTLDVTFASPSGAKSHIAAGAIRPLAMAGPGRSSGMPDLPTFSEQGYPGFELPIWSGAYAPAGTPKPILDRIRNELAAVVKLPDIAARLTEIGQTPIVNTPEEFMANYQADFPRWEALIKAAGVKVE